MMAFQRARIVSILDERREQYVRFIERLIAKAPPHEVRDHTPDAGRQMSDGHVTVVVEALEERGDEMRTTYMETLIPSVVAAGVSLRGVVGGSVEFSQLIAADVVSRLPEEDRTAATEWFADFYAGFVTQVADIATRARKE